MKIGQTDDCLTQRKETSELELENYICLLAVWSETYQMTSKISVSSLKEWQQDLSYKDCLRLNEIIGLQKLDFFSFLPLTPPLLGLEWISYNPP